jgi:small subunit ribosomal protein S8
MMTDPISDFLTRIRNALMVRHPNVSLPSSKIKVRIAEILKEEGYIHDYQLQEKTPQSVLHVELKYDDDKLPVIEGVRRVSRPGLRIYRGVDDIAAVRGGLGIAIVSTSKGVMTNAHARDQRMGGEVLCEVW